jgi:hypothetical protein
MIWVLVILLYAYDGDVIRTPLERTYDTFTECSEAKNIIIRSIADYWPNPEAGVKKIDVYCITERPFGN